MTASPRGIPLGAGYSFALAGEGVMSRVMSREGWEIWETGERVNPTWGSTKRRL